MIPEAPVLRSRVDAASAAFTRDSAANAALVAELRRKLAEAGRDHHWDGRRGSHKLIEPGRVHPLGTAREAQEARSKA